jgi:hypothetical protein
MSNNPSMYYYHNKTHDEIPEGKLCDHGCGQLATVINTHGKYTCLPIAQHCPKYIEIHSNRIKKQWENADERKEQTKISLISRLHNDENYKKIKETLKKKFGKITVDQIIEYRHYARKAHSNAQQWAR